MYLYDIEWLGDESAYLGPYARAALGALMAQNEWSWWDDREPLNTVFQRLKISRGTLPWTGDPAILCANEWLNPGKALALASAFQALLARYDGNLRIRMSRDTWDLDSQSIDALKRDLARAVGRHVIFLEWPARGKPRLTTGDNQNNRPTLSVATRLRELGERLAASSPGLQVIENDSDPDILVTEVNSVEARLAEIVILVEMDSTIALQNVETVRAQTGARCAIRLSPLLGDPAAWIRVFVGCLAGGATVEQAFDAATSNPHEMAEILSAVQNFLLSKPYQRPTIAHTRLRIPATPRPVERLDSADDTVPLHPGVPTVDSSFDTAFQYQQPVNPPDVEPISIVQAPASDYSPATEVKPVPRSRFRKAAVPVLRVLDAVLSHEGKRIDALPVSGAIDIAVFIRPRVPGDKSLSVFPDDRIEWDAPTATLQVHMCEVGREPISKKIALPRKGRSDEAHFPYEVVVNKAVDLRFVVAQGVRILHTARLKGMPGGEMAFFIEAFAGGVESIKPEFDLALVVNDSLGSRPSTMALSAKGVSLSMLDAHGISEAREAFRIELQALAKNPNADLDQGLYRIANRGKVLLDAIREYTPELAQPLRRIQLMTQADAFYPVEYLYDGEIPDQESAGVCAERAGCLSTGSAKNNCSIRDEAHQLCPMGFLGISAVIERQTWQKEVREPVWFLQPTDFAHRRPIISLDPVAYASENRADAFKTADLGPGILPVRSHDIEKMVGGRQLSWEAWKAHVQAHNPALLVLVPHVESQCLYIGNAESLAYGAIKPSHIGVGKPIVIAMGCGTAVDAVPTTELPAVLRRRGASVVIAPLTEVLGRHANFATLALVGALKSAAGGNTPVSIGEVVTRLRRDLLSKNLAIGLVIVAFGDADYVLGKTIKEELQHV